VPRFLPQHLAWHCDAHAPSHTDTSQLRAQTSTQVLLVAMAVASMDHRGIDTVLKDMRQHPEDAKVQEKGCKALNRLAFNANNKVKIGAGGGVEAIVQAMGGHRGDKEIQKNSCCALLNLGRSNRDIQQRIKRAGAEQLLRAVEPRTVKQGHTAAHQEGWCGGGGAACYVITRCHRTYQGERTGAVEPVEECMIPFLLVLNEVANERHLRAWMRKRPLKHTRLHRDCAICASLCLEMLGGLYVSHDTGSSLC